MGTGRDRVYILVTQSARARTAKTPHEIKYVGANLVSGPGATEGSIPAMLRSNKQEQRR